MDSSERCFLQPSNTTVHNQPRAAHFNFPLASLLDSHCLLLSNSLLNKFIYMQQLHSLQIRSILQYCKVVQNKNNYPGASKAHKRFDIRYLISDSHSITKTSCNDVIRQTTRVRK